MASATAKPARFMQDCPPSTPTASAPTTSSFPGASVAAGNDPVDQPAGNAGGRQDLALARDDAVRSAEIAGKIDTVAERQRQYAADHAVQDDRAPGEAFGQRDDEQRRQYCDRRHDGGLYEDQSPQGDGRNLGYEIVSGDRQRAEGEDQRSGGACQEIADRQCEQADDDGHAAPRVRLSPSAPWRAAPDARGPRAFRSRS